MNSKSRKLLDPNQMLRFALMGFFLGLVIFKAYKGEYESMIDKALLLVFMFINTRQDYHLRIKEAIIMAYANGTVKIVK